MKTQIVIEFKSEKLKDEFCGQMSDGFGENFCDFSFHKQLPDTDGTKAEHFERVKDEQSREIYFVNQVWLD